MRNSDILRSNRCCIVTLNGPKRHVGCVRKIMVIDTLLNRRGLYCAGNDDVVTSIDQYVGNNVEGDNA